MAKKTTISLQDTKHVAQLANLPLDQTQIKTFQPQLNQVLGYMSKIQAVDTQNVAETHQVTGLHNVLREDEVEPERTFTQEQALSNARWQHNGYFVVPAIFDEGESA